MTLFGRAIRYRGGWIYLTAIETGRLMLTHRSSYHICWNAFFCGGVISWCLDDWNVTTVMREELLLLKRFWDEECVSCIRDNLKFIPVLLFYVSCMYLSKVEFYTGVIVVWLFDVNKDLVKYGSISCTWSEHLRVGL